VVEFCRSGVDTKLCKSEGVPDLLLAWLHASLDNIGVSSCSVLVNIGLKSGTNFDTCV